MCPRAAYCPGGISGAIDKPEHCCADRTGEERPNQVYNREQDKCVLKRDKTNSRARPEWVGEVHQKAYQEQFRVEDE